MAVDWADANSQWMAFVEFATSRSLITKPNDRPSATWARGRPRGSGALPLQAKQKLGHG